MTIESILMGNTEDLQGTPIGMLNAGANLTSSSSSRQHGVNSCTSNDLHFLCLSEFFD